MSEEVDKFNPYGIIKDYECKTCFHECYSKEVKEHIYARGEFQLTGGSEHEHWFAAAYHPICPKCGDCNMKVILKSYSEGSWEEVKNGGKWSFGFSIQGLGFIYCSYFNINGNDI